MDNKILLGGILLTDVPEAIGFRKMFRQVQQPHPVHKLTDEQSCKAPGGSSCFCNGKTL